MAAVAIPQFAHYRHKSAKSVALSDLRNVRTILEAYCQEYQHFP